MKLTEMVLEIVLRVMMIPIVLMLSIAYHSLAIVKFMYNYIAYGGELVAYKKGDRILIAQVYEKLIKEREEKK